jgi:hypothetical protein
VNSIWAAAATRPCNGNKTGRFVKEWKVIILSLMETFTSSIRSLHGDIDIDLQCEQHLGCGCNKTVQRQRDQQVREGVEGDHLVVDGDIGIEHPVFPRRHRHSVNRAWAAAVNINFDYKVEKTSRALPYRRAAAM